MSKAGSSVAIVDYGLGNLFSVRNACERVGLSPFVTKDRREFEKADAVFLPGVGAFGDAMAELRRLDLVAALRDVAARGTPFVGICLGQQLLMSESHEFGTHKGLGLIEGPVVRFDNPKEGEKVLKIPQVGWNQIAPRDGDAASWIGSPLEGIEPGCYQYFVHSFHVQPVDPAMALSLTSYGHIEFASSLQKGNVVSFQFHPERSGPQGLKIYENLARWIARHASKEI